MKISPNPFEDIIIVDLGEPEILPVDFYLENQAGEMKYRNRIFTSKKILDVSDVPPGNYRYKLQNEKRILLEGWGEKK